MSKINITVDTETKTVTADVDGVEIPNFTSFNVYQSEYGYDMQLCSVEKVGDLNKMTYLTAYGSEKSIAKAVEDFKAVASQKYPGFYEHSKTEKVANDSVLPRGMSQYMGNWLKKGRTR